jgi:hypothetical protein
MSGGVLSDAPQRLVHTGTQQLPMSLTLDADVTRPVLTPFSAPDTPVTKTGQAPRCTTDWTLGPASGALKTVKDTSENSLNLASQARQEGESVPNLSLLLKLHLLRKFANTTKCTSPCACVLTISAIILKELG